MAQPCFSNALVGFPSQKKGKVIYESMKTTKCQGVLGNVKKSLHMLDSSKACYACQDMPSVKAYQDVPIVRVWGEHMLGNVRAKCEGNTREH